MCSHTAILMVAAVELVDALRQRVNYTGIYRCATCTHVCRLSLAYRDMQPEITIDDLVSPGPPVVYTLVDSRFVRIDPP